MPADQFRARTSPYGAAGERPREDVIPDILDARSEKLPSSGQLSAAAIAGLCLFAFELYIAWEVFLVSLVISFLMWWLLDQPWSGRRRRTRRRGITSRLLYMSTLLIAGMWLAVMFIFRASDPSLATGFNSTLPESMLGVDIGALAQLNGMKGGPAARTVSPIVTQETNLAPFSLFAHGTFSTISIALLGYAVVVGRRRRRRRLRDGMEREARASSPPSR
jgi:peptidoglycan/LPS O-acetylase OafA/YrhL